MFFVRPSRPRRFAVGALFALLAWVVVGLGKVEAGCERHPNADTERVARIQSLYPELLVPSNDLATDNDTGEFPWRTPPCSGPSCSRNPASPTSPTSFVPERVVPQWADFRVDAASAPSESWQNDAGGSIFRPILSADSIFHPPRRGF